MEKIRLRSNQFISRVSLNYQRDELTKLGADVRLLGLKGARGVGKTTLLLQYIKQEHGLNEDAVYVTLDDIYFSDNRLIDFAEKFYRTGGKFLYLDEVHKYPSWSVEIKNLYDLYPDLRIVFTGSSMLNIFQATADLSRRAIVTRLQGLSFRQFLALHHEIELPLISLESILHNANDIISDLPPDFKPYAYFQKYLTRGYYPFLREGETWFDERLSAVLQAVIEGDLLNFHHIDQQNLQKIYRILWVIASSPPLRPNISKLGERAELSRRTLLQYLHYLEQADLLNQLRSDRKGITTLQKPEKIYLENTNLLYNIAPTAFDRGAARETFVLNQLKNQHQVHYPEKGDLLVDRTYTLEIGGRKKTGQQIAGIKNAFILADDLDFAVGNKIPIWLVGLLY